MVEVINIQDIELISINQRYIVYKGKMILATRYRRFKELISMNCSNLMMRAPYEVRIEVKTHLDIDNCIKVIVDSLNKKVIDDDKNILKLEVFKERVKRNVKGSIRVFVGEIKEAVED